MSASTDVQTGDACHPIAARLSRMGDNAASMARVVHDERFQRWLGHVLDEQALHVAMRRLSAPLVIMDVEANEGSLRVAVEESAITPALSMALALPDREAACQVGSLLLTQVFSRFAPLLTGLRLRGFERIREARTGFRITAAGRSVLLCGAEGHLISHLAGVLHEIPAAVAEWGALRVRARLRLMTRQWPASVVEALSPGDVVMTAHDSDTQTMLIGTGFCMQAETQLWIDDDQVQVVGETKMDYDDVASAEAPNADVEALELPVAFEIDTARLSLAELAGIRPGYVIELDTSLTEATVRLVCHGQVIGHGQLVAVGDQIGVRISRMGLAHGIAAER